TEELAVMFDTQHTLELTEQAVALDDEKYPQSWLDQAETPLSLVILHTGWARLVTPPSRAKLVQCGTEIPKLNCKRLNAASAKLRAPAPLAWQAWNNRFSPCSKPLAKTQNARVCLEHRGEPRAHSSS